MGATSWTLRLRAGLRGAWASPPSPLLHVIWRVVGVAMLLLVWRIHGDSPWVNFTRVYPLDFQAMAVAAVGLVALGPRPVALLAASAAWVSVLFTVTGGEHAGLRFVADEYLLFAVAPGLAGLASVVCAFEHDPEVDPPLPGRIADAQLWQLKLCALSTLVFSTLHKLNADYFHPKLSCATYVERELVSLWRVPPAWLPSPGLFVLLEGLGPVLLVLYPRVGVALVLLLSVGLGHTGPFAFTTLLLGLSLACLPREVESSWSARWRLAALLFIPAATAAGSASAALYRADRGWAPYLAFDLVLVLVAVLLCVTWGRMPARWTPRLPRRPWFPERHGQRTLCMYALVLLVLNGMSPYLGLKYRYSFAMVSNLRVDDSRWNSYLFPAWMRLARDPLVHVDGVYDLDGAPMEMPATRARLIRVGVYSPQDFALRHVDAQRRKIRATLRLRHGGREYTFTDYAYSSSMRHFVAALPERPLFQSDLSLDTPQRCVH